MYTSKEIRTLIVEDDKMVMKVLTEFIEKIDKIKCVGNAYTIEEAKQMIKSKTLELVLLDVNLPDGSGIDFLKWLRVEDINVDVIMITADQRSKTIEKASRLGMVDYIVKPFKFERFETAITSYRKSKKMLTLEDDINQEAIDQIVGLSKSIDEGIWKNQTYQVIIEFLKKNEPNTYTATEVAKALGISRITARRYLESMENSGDVLMTLSYGQVGRPKNTYSYGRKKEA